MEATQKILKMHGEFVNSPDNIKKDLQGNLVPILRQKRTSQDGSPESLRIPSSSKNSRLQSISVGRQLSPDQTVFQAQLTGTAVVLNQIPTKKSEHPEPGSAIRKLNVAQIGAYANNSLSPSNQSLKVDNHTLPQSEKNLQLLSKTNLQSQKKVKLSPKPVQKTASLAINQKSKEFIGSNSSRNVLPKNRFDESYSPPKSPSKQLNPSLLDSLSKISVKMNKPSLDDQVYVAKNQKKQGIQSNFYIQNMHKMTNKISNQDLSPLMSEKNLEKRKKIQADSKSGHKDSQKIKLQFTQPNQQLQQANSDLNHENAIEPQIGNGLVKRPQFIKQYNSQKSKITEVTELKEPSKTNDIQESVENTIQHGQVNIAQMNQKHLKDITSNDFTNDDLIIQIQAPDQPSIGTTEGIPTTQKAQYRAVNRVVIPERSTDIIVREEILEAPRVTTKKIKKEQYKMNVVVQNGENMIETEQSVNELQQSNVSLQMMPEAFMNIQVNTNDPHYNQIPAGTTANNSPRIQYSPSQQNQNNMLNKTQQYFLPSLHQKKHYKKVHAPQSKDKKTNQNEKSQNPFSKKETMTFGQASKSPLRQTMQSLGLYRGKFNKTEQNSKEWRQEFNRSPPQSNNQSLSPKNSRFDPNTSRQNFDFRAAAFQTMEAKGEIVLPKEPDLATSKLSRNLPNAKSPFTVDNTPRRSRGDNRPKKKQSNHKIISCVVSKKSQKNQFSPQLQSDSVEQVSPSEISNNRLVPNFKPGRKTIFKDELKKQSFVSTSSKGSSPSKSDNENTERLSNDPKKRINDLQKAAQIAQQMYLDMSGSTSPLQNIDLRDKLKQTLNPSNENNMDFGQGITEIKFRDEMQTDLQKYLKVGVDAELQQHSPRHQIFKKTPFENSQENKTRLANQEDSEYGMNQNSDPTLHKIDQTRETRTPEQEQRLQPKEITQEPSADGQQNQILNMEEFEMLAKNAQSIQTLPDHLQRLKNLNLLKLQGNHVQSAQQAQLLAFAQSQTNGFPFFRRQSQPVQAFNSPKYDANMLSSRSFMASEQSPQVKKQATILKQHQLSSTLPGILSPKMPEKAETFVRDFSEKFAKKMSFQVQERKKMNQTTQRWNSVKPRLATNDSKFGYSEFMKQKEVKGKIKTIFMQPSQGRQTIQIQLDRMLPQINSKLQATSKLPKKIVQSKLSPGTKQVVVQHRPQAVQDFHQHTNPIDGTTTQYQNQSHLGSHIQQGFNSATTPSQKLNKIDSKVLMKYFGSPNHEANDTKADISGTGQINLVDPLEEITAGEISVDNQENANNLWSFQANYTQRDLEAENTSVGIQEEEIRSKATMLDEKRITKNDTIQNLIDIDQFEKTNEEELPSLVDINTNVKVLRNTKTSVQSGKITDPTEMEQQSKKENQNNMTPRANSSLMDIEKQQNDTQVRLQMGKDFIQNDKNLSRQVHLKHHMHKTMQNFSPSGHGLQTSFPDSSESRGHSPSQIESYIGPVKGQGQPLTPKVQFKNMGSDQHDKDNKSNQKTNQESTVTPKVSIQNKRSQDKRKKPMKLLNDCIEFKDDQIYGRTPRQLPQVITPNIRTQQTQMNKTMQDWSRQEGLLNRRTNKLFITKEQLSEMIKINMQKKKQKQSPKITQGKSVVFSQKMQQTHYFNPKALIQHNRRELENILDQDFDTESETALIRREGINVEMNSHELTVSNENNRRGTMSINNKRQSVTQKIGSNYATSRLTPQSNNIKIMEGSSHMQYIAESAIVKKEAIIDPGTSLLPQQPQSQLNKNDFENQINRQHIINKIKKREAITPSSPISPQRLDFQEKQGLNKDTTTHEWKDTPQPHNQRQFFTNITASEQNIIEAEDLPESSNNDLQFLKPKTDSLVDQQITPKAHQTVDNSNDKTNSLQKIINDPDGLNEDLNFSLANLNSRQKLKQQSNKLRRNSNCNSGERSMEFQDKKSLKNKRNSNYNTTTMSPIKENNKETPLNQDFYMTKTSVMSPNGSKPFAFTKNDKKVSKQGKNAVTPAPKQQTLNSTTPGKKETTDDQMEQGPDELNNRPSFINNDESDNISSDSYEEINENNGEEYRLSPKSPIRSAVDQQEDPSFEVEEQTV